MATVMSLSSSRYSDITRHSGDYLLVKSSYDELTSGTNRLLRPETLSVNSKLLLVDSDASDVTSTDHYKPGKMADIPGAFLQVSSPPSAFH